MEIISHLHKEEWNAIVKSFADWDIYYLCEYATSLFLHGDGKPFLLYYEDAGSRLCYVVMLADIADSPGFQGMLPRNVYFDFSTPYGYGGPLVDGAFDKKSRADFMAELQADCTQRQIIAQFIRFHPLCQNQGWIQEECDVSATKETITIHTASLEMIKQNMDSKNRNMIRKAIKLGVIIKQDKGENIDGFIQVYEATMDYNKAEDYFYFQRQYYEYLKTEMKEHMIFFYAYLEDVLISAAIFFYNERNMHYHLSGTLPAYRHTAAANLLLYEAACWGAKRGIKNLHLGGGLSAEDSLFGFKKQFNRYGRLPFYIGRNIFIEEKYKELLRIRKELDSNFNEENSFLIQYRK